MTVLPKSCLYQFENECKSCYLPVSIQSPRARSGNVQGQEKTRCLSSSTGIEFTLPSSFCFIQAYNRVNDAHPHWWGWCLISLLIQILTLKGQTSILKRQSKYHSQTQIWQRCWNYQTMNLKQLWIICQGSDQFSR